ncbi:tetratricopeptide repeat protein [Acidocella sp.]|uniref:tetratricopeptide repeat protein n=1 Tax=Acidocella sp. TaxID=50710 RepID=UPI003CFF74BA
MSPKLSLSDKLAALNPHKALIRARELKVQAEHNRAFKLYVGAAESGLTEAEREVGLYYLNGDGSGFRSAPEAARWLTQAAEKGDAKAQSALAGLYATGFKAEATTDLFTDAKSDKADFKTALRWALMAAEANDADAQALAGFLLSTGPEGIQDINLAKHWYGLAAQGGKAQGHLGLGALLLLEATTDELTFTAIDHIRVAAEADLGTAHYYLGVIYERAIGVYTDMGLAAHHYGVAAQKAIRGAQYRYGLMLFNGIGIKQNKVEGETFLRRAALAGDAEAAAFVGNIYAQGGDDLPPNYAEAALWFRIAAETGHRAASRALGLLYMTGAGAGAVPRDPDEAAKWLRIAAEQGDTVAQSDLAAMLSKRQTNSRFTEPPPVHEWFEKAAESGDAIGAYNFAVCLAEGIGVERDESLAAQWFHRAAEHVVNAQYRYGRILAEGIGVPQNFEEARYWLRQAADKNMLEALLDLAALQIQGIGGPRDDQAACDLLERAAAQGSADAMFMLGALYGGGHEVKTDRAKSLSWYQQAAEKNHPRATLMLGKYLHAGIATEPDIEAARKWFTLAAAAGLDEAQAELATFPPPAAVTE